MSTTMDRKMLELLEPSSETLVDLPPSSQFAATVKENFLTIAATEDNLLDMVSVVLFTSAIVIMAARMIMNTADSGKFNVCLYWRLSAAITSFQHMLKAKLMGDDQPLDEHNFENLGVYNPDEDPLYRRIDAGTVLRMRPQPDKVPLKGALRTEADPHQMRRFRGTTATGPTASSVSPSAWRNAADLGEPSQSIHRRSTGSDDRWSSLRRTALPTTKSASTSSAPGLVKGPPGLSMMDDDTEIMPKTNMSGASALLATVLGEEPMSSASKPGSLSGSVNSGVSLRPIGGHLSTGVGSRPARKA